MSKSVVANLLLLASTLLAFYVLPAQLPVNGLIAHYALNNSANDESRYHNHGVIIGGVARTTDRFGNPCGAMHFDGHSGYIRVAGSPSLQLPYNAITIAAWVKIDNPTTGSDKWITLVCKGSYTIENPANPQYRFQLFQGSRQSTVSVNTEFTEYDQLFNTHPFNINQWYFCVLVYDGYAVYVYQDGVNIFHFPYNGLFNANTDDLEIGHDVPGSTEFFSGAIDDLRIYDRALLPNEIEKLYNDKSGYNYADDFELSDVPVIKKNTDAGKCHAEVDLITPGLSTVCGTASIVQVAGPANHSPVTVGRHYVKYVATNDVGSVQTYGYDVWVVDNAPPVLACPPSVIITTTGAQPVAVNYTIPIATDNCPGVKTEIVSGPLPGTMCRPGNYDVTCKATDASGNVIQCSFNLNVKDVVKQLPPPAAKTDTAVTYKPAIVTPVQPKLVGDTVLVKDSVILTNCIVTFIIYDGGIEDNDTVSVYFNDKELASKVRLQNRKKNTLDNITKMTVALEKGKRNYLVSRAWNTGNTWPNSATIDVYSGVINTEEDMRGKKAIRKIIESVPGQSGAIVITCN